MNTRIPTTLEARIQRLDDLEAIRRLKHEVYCGLIDHGVSTGNPALIAPIAEHFAASFEADFTGLGIFRGAEAANFFIQGVPALLSWCQHRVSNEVIDIDGDVANAVWYVFCPAIAKPGGPFGDGGAITIIGRYREAYVREDGVWKWQRIRAELDVQTLASVGWAEATWSGH